MPAKKTKNVQKKSAKKAPAKKTTLKKKPAEKVAAKKKTTSQAKAKPVAEKKSAKKAVTAKKPTKKVAVAKKAGAKKKPASKSPQKSASGKATAPKKKTGSLQKTATKTATNRSLKKKKSSSTSKAVVSRSTDTKSSKSASIVFSLEDAERLVAAKKQKSAPEKPASKAVKKTAPPQAEAEKPAVEETPSEKRKLGAASLADILGFNPTEKKKRTELDESEIPKKWKKYYKLLIALRAHVSDEINLHSSETLKHSSREDSGDLSGYGTHQADAATDNFDRDFALSLVSNEQEALTEIEQAIMRIKNGTYGICEITGKPIPAARLTAVPFTHYSVEGQAEYEKNLRRKTDRLDPGGLFGDTSDVPKIASSDDDDDDD